MRTPSSLWLLVQGIPACALGTWPSAPWLAGWAQRCRSAAPRFAWGRQENTALRWWLAGYGARAAREPGIRGARPRLRRGERSSEAGGTHHGWEPRLSAGRWSGSWSWEPLAPALNLQSLGGVSARSPTRCPAGWKARGVQAGKQVCGEREEVRRGPAREKAQGYGC